MTDKHDDWIAIEYVREVLADVRKRLKAGAQGPGATLDADECQKVLACLVDPAFPNSRPPSDGLREAAIAIYCTKLENAGVSLKNAVADTMQRFGCSRSIVFAARKAHTQSKKSET
jgi:hypothetical protein